ncbi:glycerol dehydrogenase [Consotaella salsifontis]|uniref:Glycerol dehydrogenase n=1 Tax=Consotaella salsifontis TaxID=1365950 RepID=A0A1T4T2G8_9HYPH|nr:glycerol dehydrogenase [Consotaella salsifontis]SKA34646.1 glycerol 2-dehydrogenase (NAD+) [Consotaella salsifontis]
MTKIMISPAKFVLGGGELSRLGVYLDDYGTKSLLVAHKDDEARVATSLTACGNKITSAGFSGECSKTEIERLLGVARSGGFDCIVGLGGGKALDTAKAVANNLKAPVVVVPTIASTDAPTSALSVIYTDDGEFEEYSFYKRNPDLVLVDSAVIAAAPVRFLVAGMGDGMSTFFEARACAKSFATAMAGGQSTKAALAIAELCYRTLLEDSVKAKAACERKVVTQSLENVIEANILLSGLGFESSGLAAAHAIHNGLTRLEETHHFFHGEKVSFGTLVQLVLEAAPQAEIDTYTRYCRSVGLPLSFGELGVRDLDPDRLMDVAKAATAPNETIHNMPFKVTADMVYAALLVADQIGRAA